MKTMTYGGEGWVPGPSAPPHAPAKAFSRSGYGRIFLLGSRVMRVGLSTAPAVRWPGSGLSGRIFSGPVACVDLVNGLQASGIARVFFGRPEYFDAGGARRDGPDPQLMIAGR